MKNRKTLAIAVAAMIVSLHINGAVNAAAPTPEQLSTIESLVAAGDFAGLAEYLDAFPELMDAQSVFAQELRMFAIAYAAQVPFAFAPTTLAELQSVLASTQPAAAPAASGAPASIY